MNVGCYGFGCSGNWMLWSWMLWYSFNLGCCGFRCYGFGWYDFGRCEYSIWRRFWLFFLKAMNVGFCGFGCCVNWMLRSWMLQYSPVAGLDHRNLRVVIDLCTNFQRNRRGPPPKALFASWGGGQNFLYEDCHFSRRAPYNYLSAAHLKEIVHFQHGVLNWDSHIVARVK